MDHNTWSWNSFKGSEGGRATRWDCLQLVIFNEFISNSVLDMILILFSLMHHFDYVSVLIVNSLDMDGLLNMNIYQWWWRPWWIGKIAYFLDFSIELVVEFASKMALYTMLHLWWWRLLVILYVISSCTLRLAIFIVKVWWWWSPNSSSMPSLLFLVWSRLYH